MGFGVSKRLAAHHGLRDLRSRFVRSRGGIGRRVRLRTVWGNPWRFESSREHDSLRPVEAWCAAHQSQARFVSLSGITHKTGFFQKLATAIGLEVIENSSVIPTWRFPAALSVPFAFAKLTGVFVGTSLPSMGVADAFYDAVRVG